MHDSPVDGVRHVTGIRTWLFGAVAALSTFDPTVATVVAGVVAVFVLLFSDVTRLKMTAQVWLIISLVGWTALSGLWSVNPYSTTVSLTWAALGLMYIAGVHLIHTRRQLRSVATGYLVGAILAVVRLLVENPSMLSAGSGDRVTTVFEDVNVNYVAYALSTGFAVIVFLWTTATRRNLRTRVALVVATAAIVLGTLITQSRGAFLGLICGGVWLVVWRVFRIRTLVSITLVLIASVVLTITGVADRASLDFEVGDRATGTWSGRLPLWESARTLWSERPLVGFGASGFPYASGHQIAAHNVILDMGVGLGLVGVVIYFAFLRASLWRGTLAAPPAERSLLVGTFLAVSAPAYLTGAWVTAPAAWIALILFSRIDVLSSSDDVLSTSDQAPAPSAPTLDRHERT